MGAYEVLRPLARGGMAELFLVRATGLEGFEKVLVLKRILPHFAESQRFVRSFLDEAKLVAGFDHPNIAHVHDMGMVDGSYFFTMEYVHGIDVRTLLKRCRRNGVLLPIEHVVLITRNVASALHYAHERRGVDGSYLNVVHRDVSPSNVIVSYDGVPKLIDFGVAKAASSSIKTQTGALKGKISYMSPEQAKGAAIDRRTDVFALGIVLWEMIAGCRLYKSDNDLATIQRIIYEPPPSPRVVRADCPPGLEAIVLKALAIDINQRYQTAEELQVALEDFAFEQRIKQSSIGLSALVKDLFAAELKIWADTQAGVATVTDAIAVPPAETDETRSDSLDYLSLPLPLDGNDEDEDDGSFAWTTPASGPSPAPAVASSPVVRAATSPPGALAAIDSPERRAETSPGTALESAAISADPIVAAPRSRRRIWIAGAFAAVVVTAGLVIALSGSKTPDGSETPDQAVPAAASPAVEPRATPAQPAPVSDAPKPAGSATESSDALSAAPVAPAPPEPPEPPEQPKPKKSTDPAPKHHVPVRPDVGRKRGAKADAPVKTTKSSAKTGAKVDSSSTETTETKKFDPNSPFPPAP